jgi:DNA-binding transcriptional ArsR family regulator
MMRRTQRATSLGKALAHPVRVEVLERLAATEPLGPTDLAEAMDIALSTMSYHVNLLAELGVVELTGTAPRRGALAHFYALTATGRALVGVIETV